MRKGNLVVLSVLLLGALAVPVAAAAADPDRAPGAQPVRWESSLTAGIVLGKSIGIVKAVWWSPLPGIASVGLSFDYFFDSLPISINAALSAPLPRVSPFVCAGAGASISQGGVIHYGGGLRVRLSHKFGLVFECRRYHYRVDSWAIPGTREKAISNYLGAGISWFY